MEGSNQQVVTIESQQHEDPQRFRKLNGPDSMTKAAKGSSEAVTAADNTREYKSSPVFSDVEFSAYQLSLRELIRARQENLSRSNIANGWKMSPIDSSLQRAAIPSADKAIEDFDSSEHNLNPGVEYNLQSLFRRLVFDRNWYSECFRINKKRIGSLGIDQHFKLLDETLAAILGIAESAITTKELSNGTQACVDGDDRPTAEADFVPPTVCAMRMLSDTVPDNGCFVSELETGGEVCEQHNIGEISESKCLDSAIGKTIPQDSVIEGTNNEVPVSPLLSPGASDCCPTSDESENGTEKLVSDFVPASYSRPPNVRILHYPLNFLEQQCTICLKDGLESHRQSRLNASADDLNNTPNIFKMFGSLVVTKKWSLHDQIDDEARLREFRSFAYMKVGCVVIMALMDIIAFFLLQIFWKSGDFVCTYSVRNQTVSDLPIVDSSPRTSILIVLMIIITWNLIRLGARLTRRDADGKVIGLRYFYSWNSAIGVSELLVNLWTGLIVILSVGILWLHCALCMQETVRLIPECGLSWIYTIVRRLHLVVHVVRCVNALGDCLHVKGDLKRGLQTTVSQNKRRFIDAYARLDLDLTYICDRMIAMALPCVDGAMYRNDIRDVAKFFSSRHYGKFMIFNLCEDHEEGGNGNYDTALLYHQVQKLPCKDHNAPALSTLIFFCEQAVTFLNSDLNNVVAIHCQGGKGRTGTYCSALMLWTGLCRTADYAVEIFARRRADNRRRGDRFQGVSSPAQIRVLRYLERVIDEGLDFVSSKHMILSKISMRTTPLPTRSILYATFVVESNGIIDYDHCKAVGVLRLEKIDPENDLWAFDLCSGGIAVKGDVSVRFFYFEEDPAIKSVTQAELGPGAFTIKYGNIVGHMLCFVSFHTAFHDENISFERDQIDGAYNKGPTKFCQQFSLELHLSRNSSAGYGHRHSALGLAGASVNNITAGVPASLRFIRLQDSFHSLMERVCKDSKTFFRGETIYDPDEEDRRILIYIIDGNAELMFTSKSSEQEQKTGRILIGKGDCFGEKNFLFGINTDKINRLLSRLLQPGSAWTSGGPSLCAFTETVTVRYLEVENPSGHIPGVVPGLNIGDSAIIFEFLAKSLTARAKDAMIMSKLSKTNSENIKHDRKITMIYNRHDRYVKQITKRFKIPITEPLLFHDVAVVSSDDFGLGQGLKGRIFGFSRMIVFKAKGWKLPFQNPNTELAVPLDRIKSVRVLETQMNFLIFPVDPTAESIQQPPNNSDFAIDINTDSPNSKLLELNVILRDNYSCVNFKRILNKQIEELQNAADTKARAYPGFKMAAGLNPASEGLESDAVEQTERDVLGKLLGQSQILHFKSGETVLELGSTERRLYCIYSGVVACKSSCGKVLAKLGQGDLIGEVSFLELGNQGALSRVVAEGEVQCACMFYQSIDLLVNFDKQVGSFFFRNLAISSCLRLQQQYQTIMQTQRKVPVRTALPRSSSTRSFHRSIARGGLHMHDTSFRKLPEELSRLETVVHRLILRWQNSLLSSAFSAWQSAKDEKL